MKIILDTNVLISAFVFKGFAAKVFDYCALQNAIVLSPWIITEFKDKLENKFAIDESLVDTIL